MDSRFGVLSCRQFCTFVFIIGKDHILINLILAIKSAHKNQAESITDKPGPSLCVLLGMVEVDSKRISVGELIEADVVVSSLS